MQENKNSSVGDAGDLLQEYSDGKKLIGLDLKKESQKATNERYKQDTKLKIEMARWVKYLVSIYLVVVGCIIILYSYYKSGIADVVMIALLTTTTINILGLSYMVVRHLFPDNERRK